MSANGWGMALSIAGMAEGDIANLFGTRAATLAEIDATKKAFGDIRGANTQTQGYLTSGLQQGTQGATTGYNAATAAQQPYAQTGGSALGDLYSGLQSGRFMDQSQFVAPTAADMAQSDPGYAFRQQQGQQAIGNATSAAGSQLSGATQQALSEFNQNYASNEYANVYNRALGAFTTNKNYNVQQLQNQAQGLYGLAGIGQNAATNLGGYGMKYGNTLSNLAYGIGTQQAQYSNQYGNDLANLNIMLGNVKAGGDLGAAAALNKQGQNLQSIGGGMMGSGGSSGGGGGILSSLGASKS